MSTFSMFGARNGTRRAAPRLTVHKVELTKLELHRAVKVPGGVEMDVAEGEGVVEYTLDEQFYRRPCWIKTGLQLGYVDADEGDLDFWMWTQDQLAADITLKLEVEAGIR